jgi:hypothetical protein
VSVHERAVRLLADRLEGGGAAYRRDVALTTCELCREASCFRRCLELLSLAALVLRLRARRCARPEEVWRQGVYAGAVLLTASLVAENAAAGSGDPGRLGLAATLALATGCALGGRRAAAIAFAAAAAVVGAVWLPQGVPAGAYLSACALVIGGLLAGGHPVVGSRAASVLAVGILVVSLLAGLTLGAGSAGAASVLVFAWIAPAALLLAGWFDPRLAAAATTIVFARLAASGFGELGRALAVLQEHGQRDLLLRWLAMGGSVVAAWLVTHRSIRRTARL